MNEITITKINSIISDHNTVTERHQMNMKCSHSDISIVPYCHTEHLNNTNACPLHSCTLLPNTAITLKVRYTTCNGNLQQTKTIVMGFNYITFGRGFIEIHI